MRTPWFRWYYALGLVLAFGSLIFALILEYGENLAPCALCQLQRGAFLLIGLSFLVALAKRLSYHLIYSLAWINTLWCAFGVYFALRQLWLIYYGQPQVDICGGNLLFLFSHLPWADALKSAFLGSGDCATVTWTWLTISLPGWSAINYIILLILSWLPVCCHKLRHKPHSPIS